MLWEATEFPSPRMTCPDAQNLGIHDAAQQGDSQVDQVEALDMRGDPAPSGWASVNHRGSYDRETGGYRSEKEM